MATAKATRLPESPKFPGTVKPVHPGIYKRKVNAQSVHIAYARWDGTRWLCHVLIFNDSLTAHAKGHAAALKATSESMFQQPFLWWGLAEEPKK
jgi:hypothetical protein